MDPLYIFATAGLIVAGALSQVFRKGFDPFAPVWLFLVGYMQVYVVQALSYREYALRVRGAELVAAANLRALWALALFLAVYCFGPARAIARRLPSAPSRWSSAAVATVSPILIVWGLFCAGLAIRVRDRELTAEESLVQSFPLVLLVAGIWLIVTGRNAERPRPAWTALGLGIGASYVLIWMFNGKRSHSLFGVLTTLCAYYVPRYRRPSKPVLAAAAFAGMLAVSLAIGWRGKSEYEQSAAGFLQYLGDFKLSSILVNLNLKDRDETNPALGKPASYETEEYGGFLLMMDTVPMKSDYDFGTPYIRLISTFIPRIVWPDKPYFGREQWVGAWIAGSEFRRDATFTGPAIGILGALQLNGGAVATALMMTLLALMLRTGYEYFRLYADRPWAQAWWALTYYNAWLMTVNDDPFVWFYYNYGFTTFIPMVGLWLFLKLPGARREPVPALAAA
jgi:hypothetical protein